MREESQQVEEKMTDYLASKVSDLDAKLDALMMYLHVNMHKTSGYSVFNLDQITGQLRKKKWYEFWK